MRHRIPVARAFPGTEMMKTAGKLVVLGSINADHILNLDAFPTPGETGHQATIIRWRSVEKGPTRRWPPGAAERISRLSPAPAMTISVNASVVSWRAIKSTWRPCARLPGEATGVALIFVNAEGENVIGIHAGANAALSVSRLRRKKSVSPAHRRC